MSGQTTAWLLWHAISLSEWNGASWGLTDCCSKDIHSRQDRPTSSLIEGAFSSSIDQGAYHVAFYRTYCRGTSTEPAPRVPPGGLLPVQHRTDGQGHC